MRCDVQKMDNVQTLWQYDSMSDEDLENAWSSIRYMPELVPSPDWHKEVLAERERAYLAGESKFCPSSEVWERLFKLGEKT